MTRGVLPSVAYWHDWDLPACPRNVRYRGYLRHSADSVERPFLTLNGPRRLHWSTEGPDAVGVLLLVYQGLRRPRWVHEVKHDGYRFVARRDGDRKAAVVLWDRVACRNWCHWELPETDLSGSSSAHGSGTESAPVN